MDGKLRRRGFVTIEGETYEWEEGAWAFLVDGTGEIVTMGDARSNQYTGEVIPVDTTHPSAGGQTFRFSIDKYAVNPTGSYGKPYLLKNYSIYRFFLCSYNASRKVSNYSTLNRGGSINTNAGSNNGSMLYIICFENERPENGCVTLE